MQKVIKVAKWLLPISGLLVVALGVAIFLMTLEEFSDWTIEALSDWAIPIGLAMVLAGISELVTLKRKDKEKRTTTMLISGMIALLLGCYTIFGRGFSMIELTLPLIFAVWIASASLPRIKSALIKKEEGSPLWIFMFSFGILGIILGIVMLFNEMLSAIVVTYALAIMFITHGVNTIILFMPVKPKTKNDK